MSGRRLWLIPLLVVVLPALLSCLTPIDQDLLRQLDSTVARLIRIMLKYKIRNVDEFCCTLPRK
jgi:hypothetical protein